MGKTDGDTRGGAALSIRFITGKPIKFLCDGELIDNISPFHPERIASLILNLGDMASLLEKMEDKIDKKKTTALSEKIRTGSSFNLLDLKDQLDQIEKMGGMSSILEKIPGMGLIGEQMKNRIKSNPLSKI